MIVLHQIKGEIVRYDLDYEETNKDSESSGNN